MLRMLTGRVKSGDSTSLSELDELSMSELERFCGDTENPGGLGMGCSDERVTGRGECSESCVLQLCSHVQDNVSFNKLSKL